MSTVSAIIGRATEKTLIDKDTVGLAGLEDTHLIYVVDQADREYNKAFELGGGEPRRQIASETGGTLAASTALAADASSGASSISVDSAADATDSGGAGVIWDNNMPDYFEYTDGTTTPITGVTLIDFDHETDDRVQWLRAMPSNFDGFRGNDQTEYGVWVEGVAYKEVTGIPRHKQFHMYDNGTTKYLLFPEGLTGDFFVRYNKSGTTIDELTDNITVPVEDEGFVVFRLVQHIFKTYDPIAFERQALDAERTANKILNNALKRRNVGKRLRLGRKVPISNNFVTADLFPKR